MNLDKIMRDNNKRIIRNVAPVHKAKEKLNINPTNVFVSEKKGNMNASNQQNANFNSWTVDEPQKQDKIPVKEKQVEVKKYSEPIEKDYRDFEEKEGYDDQYQEIEGYKKKSNQSYNNYSHNRPHNKPEKVVTVYVPKGAADKKEEDYEYKPKTQEKFDEYHEGQNKQYTKQNYQRNYKGKNFYEKPAYKQEIIYVPKTENK